MKKLKHAVLAIVALFAIVGCIVGVRNLGLKEADILKAKRQAEISSFWEDYSNAKNGDSSLAKSIKKDFVEKMSKEMSVDELLDLINETLENPVTLEELISD